MASAGSERRRPISVAVGVEKHRDPSSRGGPTASSAAHPRPSCPPGRARRRRRPSARPASSSAGRCRRGGARGSRSTTLKRATSWLSRSTQLCSTERHGIPARKRFIVAVDLPAVEARQPDREAQELELQLGGQLVAVEPAPCRPGEARVVHRPVPAVAAEVGAAQSCECSATSTASGRLDAACADRARQLGATSTSPWRPAMFATSSRQPSRSYGGRSHRWTRPRASSSRAELGRARWSSFGGCDADQPRSRGAVARRTRRSRARARPRRPARSEPLVAVADVVDRQVADDPHPAACAARTSEASASSPPSSGSTRSNVLAS